MTRPPSNGSPTNGSPANGSVRKGLGPALGALLILAVAVFLVWPTSNTETSVGQVQADGQATPADESEAIQNESDAGDAEATEETGAEETGAEETGAEETQGEETEAERDTAETARTFSNLLTISRAELSAEALDTLADIASGGPYDFSKDDSTFQNREGFLPDRRGGHYREYTVITPGADTRGARRIVAGADGELYYTDDHYASFREIVG